MTTVALSLIILAFSIEPVRYKAPAIPSLALQQEIVAELNGMVDDYKRLVGTQLSQNEKQLKVRSVKLLSADDQFMYVKLEVRIREKNGLTGAILYTSDGSARGKFRWGQVLPERVCTTAGFQEFSCLTVTSIADVPHISGPNEADAAKRAIMANFPREICVPMWPSLRITGAVAPEKVRVQGRTTALKPNKLVFTVSLSNRSARSVRVKFGTVEGTAKAGIDFQATIGELYFPSGTRSRTIEVPIIPRDGNQGARQLLMNIWSPVNSKIADKEAVGVILDTGQSVPGGPVPPP